MMAADGAADGAKRGGGKRGAMSARGPNASRRLMMASSMGPWNNDFTSLLEHTVDAFTANDDSAVEDVRRILADIRKQYDDVHTEAERKEAELQRLREAIRMADTGGTVRTDELYRLEDTRQALQKQYEDTTEKINEALTNKKVYM